MKISDPNSHIGSEMPKQIFTAAEDLRYLLDRGYRKKSSIELVGNRYNLNGKHRHILFRGVSSHKDAMERREKLFPIGVIRGKRLAVDGYNVLISVETALKGDLLVLSDDGVLRDIRGVFGSYRINDSTAKALDLILRAIKDHSPGWAGFYFDSPVSKSGDLAEKTREMIRNHGINGHAEAVKAVGRSLLEEGEIVATSDSILIDKALAIVDIPAHILKSHFRDATVISFNQ